MTVPPKGMAYLAPDEELVEALCSIDSGLNDWEVDFVESLAEWVEHRELSEAQRDTAEKIAKRCGV